MIVDKRPVLLVLALRLLCALCNDGALTSRGTAIAASAGLDRDSASMESLGMIYGRKSGSKDLASRDATFRGSTVEPPTTDSHPVINDEKSSSSTIAARTTRFIAVPSNMISTDSTTDSFAISTTICDPTWPINASADTREVVNLTVDEIDTEWIVLSWESPCNATNVSLVYSIERCDDKNCTLTNGTETWHNATDLDPCTQYAFRVKILTEFWESDGANLSATTDNAISEIGDVVSLSASTISVSVIQLTWQAPAMHARCIANYSIAQCDGRSCNEAAVSGTNYTASDLEPCTEYRFTVKTLTPSVESAGVNQTARTASPKLSAPQSFHVKPGNFSLIVEWEPPESGTVCLKHYRVTTDFNKYTDNTTNTSMIISNLHACETYQVFINAVNKDDKEGDMIDKSGTTLSYRTNPPLPHTTTGILPGFKSLSMFWTIQKENNHCPLSSIITMCNYTEKRGKGYEPDNRVSSMQIDTKTAAEPTVVLNVTVDGLGPFTSYTCWAYTVNNAGYSDLSDGVNATTLEEVPSPPQFSIGNITDSQFSLSWKEPNYLPGHLEKFEIVIDWTLQYPIPSWCPREDQDKDHSKTFNVSGSVFKYAYLKAKAFTNYKIHMRAKTGQGWSNSSDSQTISSSSGVPGAISRFNSSSIMITENSNNANVLDTILTWGLPCSLNGKLEFFNVTALGIRDGYLPHLIFEEHKCTDYIYNNYMCSINLNELKGEYNYNFTISAKVRDVDTLGKLVSQNVLYPAGIPPQPKDEDIKSITLDPYKVRRSTTTAAILLPLFPNTNGNIKFYAIMVAKMGYNNARSNTRFDLKSKEWPNASSWEEAMKNDFSITYQATRQQWSPYPNNIVDYGHVKAVKYTIGEDIDCKEISSNLERQVYCNGPLKPDTWYHVRIRAFTDGGYADSVIPFTIKTNAELNVALVIGAVFGILFVGILVTMMLLVRKCSPHIYKFDDVNSHISR